MNPGQRKPYSIGLRLSWTFAGQTLLGLGAASLGIYLVMLINLSHRADAERLRHARRALVQGRVVERRLLVRHARVRERTAEEGDQVGLLLRREAQRQDVRVLVRRVEVAAAVVERDDVLERPEAARVEVPGILPAIFFTRRSCNTRSIAAHLLNQINFYSFKR